MPDGQAPQGARLASAWVRMGQGADPTGCLDEGHRVVQVRQRHRSSAHERTVAACSAGPLMERRGSSGHRLGRWARPDGPEDLAGLDTDVGRISGEPASHAERDLIEGSGRP